MSRQTPHFGFQVIEPGDNPYLNGHKFFAADRDLLDMILWLAMSGHEHSGGTAGGIDAPDTAPGLTLSATGGTIAADAQIWYVYTLVNQLTGVETGPSPAALITTPAPILAPNAPAISWGSLSGTLLPGQYFYRVSAYTDVTTNETKADSAVGVIVGPGTATNRVILELPDLPTGADGFNIYRRAPGGSKYLHLDTVDMTVATPPSEYIDDGTVEEDCDRSPAVRNNTNATNSITITLPDDVVPEGYFWKVYRTVNDGDYSASLLHYTVEETAEGSGIITPLFVDIGYQVTTGEPPTGTFDFSFPEKILLTDAAHITGAAPTGRVGAYPHVETFVFPGPVSAETGVFQWRCPYPNARVLAVACQLGLDSAPAAQPVQVQVLRHSAGVHTSMYDDPTYPEVPVGENAGDWLAPPDPIELVRDDTVTVDVIQDGGGATATDDNLAVSVYIVAYGFDPDTTFTPDLPAPLALF